MPATLRGPRFRLLSKPYERRSPSLDPSSSALSDYQESVVSPLISSPDISDKPGFPTYSQYKRIEAIYLDSLSPRKRDKALITQVMFDKIWDVLHQPDACNIETPQFRFWVRKMFTLSRPQGRQFGNPEDDSSELPAVVLHENRPVAVMEQLYELFCYCHEQSNHGGRDKTCAVIRQHYSWVPKELTAQFVKACPTCILKRSGNPDMLALVQEQAQVHQKDIREETDDGSTLRAWPPTGGPLDPPITHQSPDLLRHRGDISPLRPGSAASNVSIRSCTISGSIPTIPIARDVAEWDNVPSPLTDDFSFDATPRPNDVPQTPALVFTYDPLGRENGFDPGEGRIEGIQLPSLKDALLDGSQDDNFKLSELWPENLGECLPPSLQQLQISSPVEQQIPYVFQIDPVLLAFDYPGSKVTLYERDSVADDLSKNTSSILQSLDVDVYPPCDVLAQKHRSSDSFLIDSFSGKYGLEGGFSDFLAVHSRPSGFTPDSQYSELSEFPMASHTGYTPRSSSLSSATDNVESIPRSVQGKTSHT